MKAQIALLVDKEDNLTDIFHMTSLVIYERNESWQITKTIPLAVGSLERTEDVKTFIVQLIEELKCCKYVVGSLIIGIPYFLLSKAGYEVFEAKACSIELLEQIYADFMVEKEEAAANDIAANIPKAPMPTNDQGDYFIDMISAQKAHPQLSSKKILLPFFSQEAYVSLTIQCSHVMPWLENFMEEHHLEADISRNEGRYTVVITHKCCQS